MPNSIRSWSVKYINLVANTVYEHELEQFSNLVMVRNPSNTVRILFGNDSGITTTRYQSFSDVDGGGFFVRPEAIQTLYLLATQDVTRVTIEEYFVEDPSMFFTSTKPPSVDVSILSTVGLKPGDLHLDASKDLQVDVVSLPPLPAGTNNIGDVDVLSLPSLPAGANTIGTIYAKSVDSTILASGTRIASGVSADYSYVNSYKEGVFFLNVTAASGTLPTLAVDVEVKDVVTGEYYLLVSFSQKTAVGKEKIGLPNCIGNSIRVKYTIGGTTPSFTFSVTVALKN